MINWFKGVFIHKVGDKDHFPVERYSGVSVIGYKCSGCGYEWYEKRNVIKNDCGNAKAPPLDDDRFLVDVSDTVEGRLWMMLDDIDTLQDAIKPNDIEGYKAFYKHTLAFANKRHLLLQSDGYKIYKVKGAD